MGRHRKSCSQPGLIAIPAFVVVALWFHAQPQAIDYEPAWVAWADIIFPLARLMSWMAAGLTDTAAWDHFARAVVGPVSWKREAAAIAVVALMGGIGLMTNLYIWAALGIWLVRSIRKGTIAPSPRDFTREQIDAWIADDEQGMRQ